MLGRGCSLAQRANKLIEFQKARKHAKKLKKTRKHTSPPVLNPRSGSAGLDASYQESRPDPDFDITDHRGVNSSLQSYWLQFFEVSISQYCIFFMSRVSSSHGKLAAVESCQLTWQAGRLQNFLVPLVIVKSRLPLSGGRSGARSC